jgi:hypothetical protein
LQGALQLIIGRLEDGATKLHDGLARADWASQRDLIRALVQRVEVARHEVNVVFRIDPYPSDNDPEKKSLQLCRESVNRVVRGVCGRALEPQRWRKGCQGTAMVANRTWGNPTVRDDKGGLGKHGYGGIVNPPRHRKSGSGNPPPKARAPEFYPDCRQWPDSDGKHIRGVGRSRPTSGLDVKTTAALRWQP